MEQAQVRIGPPQTLYRQTQRGTGHSALSPDGRLLVADVGWQRGVVLDPSRPDQRKFLGDHPGIHFVAVSPDNRWIVTGPWNAADVKVWDAQTRELVCTLPAARSAQAGFSPDGKWLVTSSLREYAFWQVGTWRFCHRVPKTSPSTTPLAFAPDGRLMAIAADPREVRLIEPDTAAEIATLSAPEPEALTMLCFSPDGSLLAAGTASGTIQLWDLRRIRAHLADQDLDWDHPALPEQSARDARPLQVELLLK
jgi:WD40 repeat protein